MNFESPTNRVGVRILAVLGTSCDRPDGNNSNTGLSNSAGGAWRTIDYAADNIPIGGGHTIRVQAGTYSEYISPNRSGVIGSTNTFVADGAVTDCGMDLTGQQYQRWIGFTFDSDAGCTRRNRTSKA